MHDNIAYPTELKIRNYKYLDTWPNTFQSSWPFPKVFGLLIHVYSLLPINIDHMNDITTYNRSLILLHEVDTCYNGSLCYIGIYFQLLSIVPAASNLPLRNSKYKFTKYFTLLRKGLNSHFSIYLEMSNYGQKLADGRLLF